MITIGKLLSVSVCEFTVPTNNKKKPRTLHFKSVREERFIKKISPNILKTHHSKGEQFVDLKVYTQKLPDNAEEFYIRTNWHA